MLFNKRAHITKGVIQWGPGKRREMGNLKIIAKNINKKLKTNNILKWGYLL